jgi:hypothetical protein
MYIIFLTATRVKTTLPFARPCGHGFPKMQLAGLATFFPVA